MADTRDLSAGVDLVCWSHMDHGLFHLDKWYLDAVTDDGLCVVAYVARVRAGSRSVGLVAATMSDSDSAPNTRSTVLHAAEPSLIDSGVRWTCPALRLDMAVEPIFPGVSRTLLESPDGSIEWHCHAPGARVSLTLDGTPLKGLGYCERLTMNIRPDRLPIRQLRWGRFVGADPAQSVVWIQWRGSRDLDLLLHDGVDSANPSIADRGCSWSDRDGSRHDLALSQLRTLRSGPVAGVLGVALATLGPIVPPLLRDVAGIHETKWISRGALTGAGVRAQGFAIHELVEFRGVRP